MRNRSMSCTLQMGRLVLCLVLFAATAGSLALTPEGGRKQANPTAAPAPQVHPVSGRPLVEALPGETLNEQVNRAFRLRSSRVISMAVTDVPAVAIGTAIAIDGQVFTLNLQPHSVRAPGYQLQAQIADGSIINVDPGPDRMLRGSLLEVPGSQVAGGLLEDGLHITILMPDGERVWAEPLQGRVAGAQPDQYVVYRDHEVIHPEGSCGVTPEFIAAHPVPEIPPVVGGDEGGIAGSIIYCTELACDADFEFYTAYASNVTLVQNRINLVINTMNLQYISQVDIQHVITSIIVRTAEPDPYTSTNASTLLNQVANHWNANHTSIPRDVVQLFTAKSIDGGTIGIAFLGSVCNTNSNAYSMVQSDCCGSLACATDLSAHELGHSWSANHCSCPSSTMNPSITCTNTFANSSPSTVTEIIAFRNSRPCLSQCADATLPFFDDFPSTTIDPAKWTTIVAVTSNTLGTAEPSAPNSLNLKGSANGGTQIRTSRIIATGLADFQMSYKYEARGGGDPPETGDNLVVEYFNNLGVWTQINLHTPAGTSQTTYTTATVNFPADALHSEFRARFRNTSTQGSLDDWFVDDVNILGYVIPVNDTCGAATIKSVGTSAISNQGATTDGPDETGCGFSAPTQITKDIWFKWLTPCAGTATVSLCGASFDARLAAYLGCPGGPGLTLACNDNFCGSSPQISFSVNQSQLIRIRIGGVNNASGTGSLVISCTPAPPPCPADVNNSGAVNIDDLVVVITNWGATSGPADINLDNIVNIDDLVMVITGWGICP